MNKRRWDASDGELSEGVLRDRFRGDAFRVAHYSCPGGTNFVGRTRACTIYLMRGSCRLRADNDEGPFSQGDIVQVGGGSYELAVPGTSEVEIVTVWDLKPHMN